jgi:hypothetical protein
VFHIDPALGKLDVIAYIQEVVQITVSFGIEYRLHADDTSLNASRKVKDASSLHQRLTRRVEWCATHWLLLIEEELQIAKLVYKLISERSLTAP